MPHASQWKTTLQEEIETLNKNKTCNLLNFIQVKRLSGSRFAKSNEMAIIMCNNNVEDWWSKNILKEYT